MWQYLGIFSYMSLTKIVCGSESLSLCISANLLKLFSLVHARQTFGCELLNLAKVRSLSQPKLAAKIQIWLGTWFLWFLRFQSPGRHLLCICWKFLTKLILSLNKWKQELFVIEKLYIRRASETQGPILEATGGPDGDLNVGGWGSGPKHSKNI